MALTLRDENEIAIPGFLANARTESLIILHDMFGLTNQMRGVAKRFAGIGWTSFVLDLFGGQTTDDESKGGALVMGTNWKKSIERIASTQRALSELGRGAKVAIVGFGFGGAMALAAASHVATLSACVSFYGIPTVNRGDLLNIACPVQGHFGSQDKKFTKDRVDALEAKLKSAGIQTEFHRYHTGHFFFIETRKLTHSPHNTELSFHRTLAFLKRSMAVDW